MRFLFFANQPDISFGKQALILINELRTMGHQVLHVDHTAPTIVKKKAYETFKPDVIVVWTFFHDIGHPTIMINELPKPRNYFLVGFEVSDTTRLSKKAIDMVNELNPDILLTPSTWSANGFWGTSVPIVVLPHAVDPELLNALKYLSKFRYPLLNYNNPRVLVYANHSFDRKGWDIALNVLKDFCNRNDGSVPKFDVIMKSWQAIRRPNDFTCNTLVISGHQPALLHYATMNQATHFFYPVRGGAFEISVLEMLALGKTVVIPEKGAWTDIPLSKDDVYWIKVSGFKRYWFDNPYHVGEFVEPDPEDAKEKFRESLISPLEVDAKKYQEEYSPRKIATQFLEIIRR